MIDNSIKINNKQQKRKNFLEEGTTNPPPKNSVGGNGLNNKPKPKKATKNNQQQKHQTCTTTKKTSSTKVTTQTQLLTWRSSSEPTAETTQKTATYGKRKGRRKRLRSWRQRQEGKRKQQGILLLQHELNWILKNEESQIACDKSHQRPKKSKGSIASK